MNYSRDKQQTESFTKRWSRKKGLAKRSEHTEEDESILTDSVEPTCEGPATPARENDAIEKPGKSTALNALGDKDMPPIDSLDENSDFAQFMSTNVSEQLRKLALRKLFHSKTYNIRDGLDEYDGDYTSFEKLDPSTITADMRHMIEVEEQKQKLLEEQLQASHQKVSAISEPLPQVDEAPVDEERAEISTQAQQDTDNDEQKETLGRAESDECTKDANEIDDEETKQHE